VVQPRDAAIAPETAAERRDGGADAGDEANGRLLTAEILSIGSEITAGETRDTNASELARALVGAGVRVLRLQALPDELRTVRDGFAGALERADLVVSTGGLGPTPDDLTREAIAAVVDETPVVAPDLEAWLRGLWARRGMPFPVLNLKQAWLIPSATALPNPNGTAPGWWVQTQAGGVVVALPGPPREMRPMWQEQVMPRLTARGLGAQMAVRTLRLAGIGESQAADVLGEALLRADNPQVATYARAESLDIRISAVPSTVDGMARTAEELADEAEARVMSLLGEHVWGRGQATWGDAIGDELDRLGRTLALVEVGTGGSLAALLGARPWLRFAESMAPDVPALSLPGSGGRRGNGSGAEVGLEGLASRASQLGGASVAVAVRARPRRQDTTVAVAIVDPDGSMRKRQVVFLGGEHGRARSALTAASLLLARLRAAAPPAPDGSGAAPGATTVVR
jgi:nicotinamide-nucleotide amidase